MSSPCVGSRDDFILGSLQHLKDDFFNSLQSNANSLTPFFESWKAFDEKIRSCRDSLPIDTLEMVYAFATTVSTVASGILDLETAGDRICHQFSMDISTILDDGLGKLNLQDDEQLNGGARIIDYIHTRLMGYV